MSTQATRRDLSVTTVESAFDACIVALESQSGDLVALLTALATVVDADETIPSGLGEFRMADLWDVVSGAYVWVAHNHGGQGSAEYALLSELSKVFDPGGWMDGAEDALQEEDWDAVDDEYASAHWVYQGLAQWNACSRPE